MASFQKHDNRVALHFKGDGPLGTVFAEGDSNGQVRGYVTNPQIHLPSRNGKLNVGGGIGKGILTIVASVPNEKQPYSGSVDIQTGEIGEDIAFYLFQSQQIQSVVALGVFVEPDNSVSAAGGMILQVMPGVSEKTLQALEARVPQMRSVTELIRGGAKTEDLVFEVLEDLSFRKLDESVALTYNCHCSVQRVHRSLLLLGAVELESMVQKAETSDIQCDFCGRHYLVDLDTLIGLLSLSKRKYDALS